MASNPDSKLHIPDEMFNFFNSLNTAVDTGDISSFHNLYENIFPSHLSKYYAAEQGEFRPLPVLQRMEVAECFGNDTAGKLYSFLCFKHLFTDRDVTAEDAKVSWRTFCDLFVSLPGSCDIPNWFLWDIFDEFLFQMTVVYQKRFAEGAEWSVTEAVQMMEKVISESGIEEVMESDKADDITKSGENHVRWMSGFFGIITVAKINVLLGDYNSALSVLKPLDIYGRGKKILAEVAPANVSLMYYVGFSYLMLRRYADASRVFRQSLSAKVSSRKFSERVRLDCAFMHVVSCILCGTQPDNLSWLMDSRKLQVLEDDKELLATGDEERFRDVFDRCSPKFLAVPPVPPTVCKGMEGKELQARLFLRAVKQQQDTIKLRVYLGVYQTTTTELVKTVLDVNDGLVPLFAMKLTSRQLVHDGVSADLHSGTYVVRAALDCTVEGDNICVVQKSSYRTIESKYFKRMTQRRPRHRHFDNPRQGRRPAPDAHNTN
ncbi:EIF3-interacting protein, putative [Trypanosoma brucei gambiense DAL972]|uniref:Eukaryotic translation initiation factor 3 subunit L n=3 Tax=Trypanosoma brucei TaxID=5691 RepID=Q38BD7_TRYB2|nr:EIF3-interacting protein, putative [Trypanosoma brucei gambiense DAL972]XP_822711.1 EIF3-interacting protein, putative [Trypanosoma brucei brucei TREU927]EAN77883.1 EIF3-interacting protein, putative [Trypanosoma brucei brucei TREU927]RHW68547.1 eukaryotic translation initiation factor 3 subunit L [Trypanosoma brucei equiperdum]CBH15481.1 EIF3-interacting protein, putative [Trypanosoma brucei gambiense DAL972]|eukprot:XP_011777745.1 EIF3-interacting protein, putative [Trypanosoma brucei gambiense DAL972]